MRNGQRDALFMRFMSGVFVLLILYGIGTLLVVLFGDTNLARTMLAGFASMFAGALGIGSGYLLGRSNGNGHDKEQT